MRMPWLAGCSRYSGRSLVDRRCACTSSASAPEARPATARSSSGTAARLALRVRRRDVADPTSGAAPRALLRFFASVGGIGGSRRKCFGCVGA